LPPTDRRIALVIGNSSYKEVGPLNNPGNDARAVAGAFRRLGFALVREHFDLDLRSLTGALKEFGDLAIEASWAVIYYAGHGIEMDGVSYVIPTDAKLLRDVHILDETVPLHHLLAKVEPAGKLRLVILDACRTNPFVSRMVRTGGLTRSLGRGLAHIEPAAGVLVAYSAKHGTLAADGPGKHSPFAEAEALLAHMEQPGLELNFVFRRARDHVLQATGGKQEPFLYGSLPGESLFFITAGGP
jgi:uncharacterized caspase-like protein